MQENIYAGINFIKKFKITIRRQRQMDFGNFASLVYIHSKFPVSQDYVMRPCLKTGE